MATILSKLPGRIGNLILMTGVAAFLALGMASSAMALGGGGGARAQNATPSCPSGQYYSTRCKECAKNCRSGYVWACGRGCVQQSSMILKDDELYSEAISLIRSEFYAEALDLLWAIKRQDDPKVLNYIGFSSRQLGDLKTGIAYYQKALALDPNYNLAREYLGEGYLQSGDVAAAKAQLAEIATRCGRDCREHQVLARAIADHEAGRAARAKTW